MTIKTRVLDNVITHRLQDELEKQLLDYRFPWYYSPSSDLGYDITSSYLKEKQALYDDINIIDPPQFYHDLFNGNQPNIYFKWFTPILDAIKFKGMTILRMKLNITSPYIGATELSYGIPHADLPQEQGYTTGVYYVTDADGDTLLFNEKVGHAGKLTLQKRVQPKKGRLLLFDGCTLHAPTPPVSNRTRVVLNLNIR